MELRNNKDYYVARAAVSHRLARKAINPTIAAIHADLADRYERLAIIAQQDGDDEIIVLQAT